jgi:hypothetical protein
MKFCKFKIQCKYTLLIIFIKIKKNEWTIIKNIFYQSILDH